MNYVLAENFTRLRDQALVVPSRATGAADEVLGVLVEVGYPEAIETLVALNDGTASLYFSNGGSKVGLAGHEGTAVAARTLLAYAAHNTDALVATTSTPLPRPDHTLFYILTQRGILAAEARVADLEANRHALSPLYYAAHELITEMRMIDEAQDSR